MAYFMDQFGDLAKKMLETLDLESMTKKVLSRSTPKHQKLFVVSHMAQKFGKQSVPYLEKIAKDSKDPDVRAAATRGLRDIS